MMDSLNQKLEILHFINNARWNEENNYYMPGYHPLLDKLEQQKDEAKLLTHWLCYISDRQTPFRRIFKDGARAYSYIVYLFYTENKNVIDILNTCFNAKERKFKCKDDGKEVSFASRFMPADIVCIYKTLQNLKSNYNGSFGKFLKEACKVSQIGAIQLSAVQNLAINLYVLTYENIGQPTYADIITKENLDEDRIKNFSNIDFKELKLNKKQKEQINLKKNFTKQVMSALETNMMLRFDWNNIKFLQKRLWCVIRDFLRYKHFNEMFARIVGDDFSIECNKALLKDLELPGDVWNQNDKFKNCFWGKDKLPDKGPLPKNIREFYQKQFQDHNTLQFIPEDYDVTFEFVPRMCAKEECVVCPFNMQKGNKVLELCHQKEGNLCPVIKFCSGSNFKCIGASKCPIQKHHKEDE